MIPAVWSGLWPKRSGAFGFILAAAIGGCGKEPENNQPAGFPPPAAPIWAKDGGQATPRDPAQVKKDLEEMRRKSEAASDWQSRAMQASNLSLKLHGLRREYVDAANAIFEAIPREHQELRLQILRERGKFNMPKLDKVLPGHPLLRPAALAYIDGRLKVERACLEQLQPLLSKVPEGVLPHIVTNAQKQRDMSQQTIEVLASARPLIAALPEQSIPVASNVPKQDPRKPSTGAKPAPVTPSTTPTATNPPKGTAATETPGSSDWQVTADPGLAPAKLPTKLLFKELKGVHPHLILYPPSLTPFFMVGMGQSAPQYAGEYIHLVVGDLRAGKPLGIIQQVKLRAQPWSLNNRPSLAPDGQSVAFHEFASQALKIIEVKSGKTKQLIPLKVLSAAYLFPKPNQILAVVYDLPKRHAKLWDVATGAVVVEFPLPDGLEDNAGYLAVSPGSRFLAVAIREKAVLPDAIHIFQLTTGKLAGTIRPGSPGSRVPAHVQALAFSPDGQEIAALVNYPHRVNLFAMEPAVTCWQLATGQESSRSWIQWDKGGGGQLLVQSPEPLQWFPDQQGWLIDQRLVISRSDGKLLQRITAEGTDRAYFATKILDDQRVLAAIPGYKLGVQRVNRPAASSPPAKK